MRAAGSRDRAASWTPAESGPGHGASGHPGLVEATIRLCRALRRREAGPTTGNVLAAVRALDRIDLADRREVYLALRTVLVGRVEEYAAFDEAFEEVLGGAPANLRRPRAAGSGAGESESKDRPGAARGRQLSLERWLEGASDAQPTAVPVASADERLGEKDFAAFSTEELEAVERLAAQLARRLAARPGRRWIVARRGPRVHAARTVRRSLRTGGNAVQLALRERKPKRVKLVVLCDVSGSMDLYSRLLLQFLYALQNRFARMETFLFATRLSRVTAELRGPSYRVALARLATPVRDWSGGTRIGGALTAFRAGWPRLVDRRTVVVILSDGWDTGDPRELGDALRAIARHAGKVVWLNPLLGSPSYQPLTRGMQAALPHVNVFASAHSLDSLRALVRHLRL